MKRIFKPSRYYFTFGPNEPAFRVEPGDTVTINTVDARGFDEHYRPIPDELKQRSEGVIYHERNPLVGPFYIEGAEPGDALSVEIERIHPNRDTAWSRIGPHFGSLTEEVPGRRLLLNEPLPRLHFSWRLDLERNVGILDLPKSKIGRVEIGLHPFIGSIGVAPPQGRVEPSLTPGEYGGNMDCVETKEGTTLYLPVFVRGAYLAFGDVHATQGDGELCGTALEVSAEVTVKVDLVKGWGIGWPRLEDEEHIMVAGSSRPLMEAYKIAHLELIEWLTKDYGFDRMEALQVVTQVGTCRIGNVVDPNYTVVAKFPKRYLPTS